MKLLLKHLGRLLSEIFEFARKNKAWWIIPLVLILLMFTAFIIAGSSAAPFIYTLF